MEPRLLSTWNQVAPRGHVRMWYCFPRENLNREDDQDIQALEEHLTLALARLGDVYPEVKGEVSLLSEPKGRLSFSMKADAKIPLGVVDMSDCFGWTYRELEEQGFPAKAFVSGCFDYTWQLGEGAPGLPVLVVQAWLIEGGLLLGIYAHHSVFDGLGIDVFTKAFAELTVNPSQPLEARHAFDFNLDLPRDDEAQPTSAAEIVEVIKDRTAYCLLPGPDGPTDYLMPPVGTPFSRIKKTGRTFVFKESRLRDLQKTLASKLSHDTGAARRAPSVFTCLAIISWAHTTKARLDNSVDFLSEEKDGLDAPGKVRLWVPADWRRRAYPSIMSSSVGNNVTLPVVTVDTETVLRACDEDQDIACEAMATIVAAFDKAMRAVDEDLVTQVTKLFRTVPDPRSIGVNADPRDPYVFGINTWRHFGNDLRWGFPGMIEDAGSEGKGVLADVVRRAQGAWNMGAGLLLPAGRDKSKFELLVTLDKESMGRLCRDAAWLRWIDRVVM